MKYNVLLFDLDGTLTESALGITRSVAYAFEKMGREVPPQEVLDSFIGPPLVDPQAKFLQTASYGDTLHIDVSIAEWRGKSFVQQYRVRRDDTAILECQEVRIFGGRREDGTLFAHKVPEAIRAACGG